MHIRFIRLSLIVLRRNLALFIFFFIFFIPSFGKKGDSLYIEKYSKTIYYNSDTIFYNYARYGFNSVIEDLYEYYEDIFWNLSPERQEYELKKMKYIADENHCEELHQEFNFMNSLLLPSKNSEQFDAKVKCIGQIVSDAVKHKNTSLELRGMEALINLYWNSMNYARAFRQIRLIERKLESLKEEEYPEKSRMYFQIGEAYFFFQDYDKAIPYLRKALKPSKYYFDRSNLRARNTLGTYYNLKGEIDSAEYYFRSAYNNFDIVRGRSMFDALSLSNLGHSLVKRQKYNEAIPYFRVALNRMILDYDHNYKLASETTVGLAECYFSINNMEKAKHMIDSSLLFIARSNNVDLYRSIYPIMCKYYARMRDTDLTKAYLDSTIIANESYMQKYSGLSILRAEQELFEAEKKAKDEELSYNEKIYKSRLIYGSVIMLFIFLGLVFFIVLYRSKRKAYQALVIKNQAWAESNPVYNTYEKSIASVDSAEDLAPQMNESVNEPDVEDVKLMQQVYDLIKKEKIFKDLDLTLDSLSKQMNINRNYLSKAINKTTGKNFNSYINEYRIKEAIKIMSDEKSDLISLDAIALEVGFSNRTSFYQSFKKVTGLTPSDFRNNKIKSEDSDVG
ncbi:helix-turn-helix domain-containing protein [Dysgonomonas sp. Marseille-P4677]|uniref:helix-turn-helix domain-containing protein n=1 Tax=Dysgonomonas sp. Marseille-P4677 TaxID=2364790 RepID=UPI0019116E51|nr:helix-turn-helix domain-containing protein [Dysgonomonas sp. Marseille-P4677]MBK5722331.1 helix-turn-helix domain-containing protein [Dysgonomonas sp. Marseille-P4677]